MLDTLSVIFALTLQASAPQATASSGTRVQRITAEARVRRGRVRRARYMATQRALVEAVWRRLQSWVAPRQRTSRLRRSLGRRVRPLIARYRTKRLHRDGTRLYVTLAVTVDDQALKARLRRLGVRLLAPGVLVLSHCTAGKLAPPLVRTLKQSGVRAVLGPWPPLARDGIAAAARDDPRLAARRAREAGTRVALVATCVASPARPLNGTTQLRARVDLRLTLHTVGALTPVLWQLDVPAEAVAATAKAARRGAFERAAHALSYRLTRALPSRLPDGPARRLRLRLAGGLPVADQLTLARRLAREVPGVRSVTPARFATGQTWLTVATVHGLGALKRALDRLPPPAGWTWRTQVVRPAGYLALTLTVKEDP